MTNAVDDSGNLKNLKSYKFGIVMGILAIIVSLLITGVPIGSSPIELVNIAIYLLGVIVMLIISLKKKNDKISLIYTLIYLVTTIVLIAIIESNYDDFKLYAIGWIPGFVISTIGLLRTKDNKKNYNIKVSMILNIIGLILSLISLILVIPNGGFLISK